MGEWRVVTEDGLTWGHIFDGDALVIEDIDVDEARRAVEAYNTLAQTLAAERRKTAALVHKCETLMGLATCFEFALRAIQAADENEHGIHDDCDGMVASAALEAGRKLVALAATPTADPTQGSGGEDAT